MIKVILFVIALYSSLTYFYVQGDLKIIAVIVAWSSIILLKLEGMSK